MNETIEIEKAVQVISKAAQRHCGHSYLNAPYLRTLFSGATNVDPREAADKFERGLEKYAGHICPPAEAYDRALQWLEAHCRNAI
jgi:hypothetical protein